MSIIGKFLFYSNGHKNDYFAQTNDIMGHTIKETCWILGELIGLLKEYEFFFDDEPGRTVLTCHDVDEGYDKPINQQPYRLSTHKLTLQVLVYVCLTSDLYGKR